MILRTGADLCFLGPKFGIEQRYCGFVFRRVVSRIKGLSVLYLRFPSQEEARSRCISKFREVYDTDDLRAIIDCFEFRIPKVVNQRIARKNHSEYKKGYTGKVLVAMSPGGHISFVSN